MFECKNYGSDVADPELDQISGRFSPSRGRLGFLCCRGFENRDRFVQRCRDTFKDDRGLGIPLDDNIIKAWLELIWSGRRRVLDTQITAAIDEIWYS